MSDLPKFQLPPFEPSPSDLSSLVDSLSTSLSEYSSASSPAGKDAALRALAQRSLQLSRAAADPIAAGEQFRDQLYALACWRIAFDMGVFEALSVSEPAGLQQIASATSAELEFTLRITRALAAVGVLHEVEEGLYMRSPMSRMMPDRRMKGALKLFDDSILTVSRLSDYFATYGFKSPSDPKNAPFIFAKGERDVDFFSLIYRDKSGLDYQDVTTLSLALHGSELLDSFRFDNLKVNDSGVALVDVSGGRGYTLLEILRAFPEMEGRFILEDLKVVLDNRAVGLDDRIEVQPYDLLSGEVQPVTGATAYLFRNIFHNWPDSQCLTILANLAPAMRGHNSKLLICDNVFPDRNPPAAKVLADMWVLQMAGKERSVRQWTSLLSKAGFWIVKIHGLDNPKHSVIEAVLMD